ncbi:MAG: transglycosylase domain-containing protein, partial [Firmicutes bacterium]|nr:transglycosylase domain-containing protein [Bacillota bacterium]
MEYLSEHQYETAIFIISVIAFIIGIFAIGFLKSLLIIGILDGVLFVPNLLNIINKKKNMEVTMEKKNTRSAKHARTGNKKTEEKEITATVASTRSARASKKVNSKKAKDKTKKKKIGKKVLMVLLILGILFLILLGLFMFKIVKDAPKFSTQQLYHQEASILYSTDGSIIDKLGSENREKISYDQMPEVLVDAIVATEDSRFFQHNGFDLPRFVKASFGTLLGKNAGGASTLTMQIAKNHFTSTNRSITRKFTDIYMSIFQIEKHYTKQEILEFYVNAPYLGSGAWGVEQACLTYFGKSAKDINLAEAAMIAGMFQAPNTYDPNIHPDLAEKRRQTVLYLMKRHKYIDEKEYNAAMKLTVDKILKKSDGTGDANPHKYQSFIDAVVVDVKERTGLNPYNVSMQIYTTMNKEQQQHVEDVMNGKTFKWENDVVQGGVAVVDVKTGAVAAIGGGRNVNAARTLNRATQLNKQIGSTAKPIYDYGPGMEFNNWSTATPFADEPHS